MMIFNRTNFSQQTIENYYTQNDFYYPFNNETGEVGFNMAFNILFANGSLVPNVEQYFHI